MGTSTAPPEWDPSSSDDVVEESSLSTSSSSLLSFDRDRHVAYLKMMYQMLPYHYQSQEINSITYAHFAISGLDILGALECVSCSIKTFYTIQVLFGSQENLKFLPILFVVLE